MCQQSRRTFATGAGALLACLACEPGWAKQAPSAKQIKLGLASYTFRSFARAQVIAAMKQLSIPSLNAKDVKDHLPAAPPGEAEALAAYGAAAVTLHAAGTLSLAKVEDLEGRFQYCKRAGIRVMVGGDPAPENLALIENYARQYDIRVAIHNHGPEDARWHSPLDVMHAVAKMDERLGCCMDVGHTVRSGVDVVDAIRAVGHRLFNVHIKDLAHAGEKESQVAVGRGTIDIPGIFDALLRTTYQGYVDLEYEIEPDNPMPGVVSSFAYMRGVTAKLG